VTAYEKTKDLEDNKIKIAACKILLFNVKRKNGLIDKPVEYVHLKINNQVDVRQNKFCRSLFRIAFL